MGDEFLPSEAEAKVVNGWIALLIVLALLAFGVYFLAAGLPRSEGGPLGTGLALVTVGLICLHGMFTLQPNEAAVMTFFGSYAGTERHAGFHWANPFCQRRRMSLRAHNLTTPILKVNDGRGSPIEIGAVVVWRVQDTARACFEVEDYTEYVRLQCESGLREVASRHAYDNADETLLGGRVRTLRGDAERISETLRATIQARAGLAGVAVEEARIAHIAYAPEIAPAMLRRQQAEAVIAARRKLVEGAVGMVEMALIDINERCLASFTPAQKVALVTNLMTVLVGEGQPQPVVPMKQES
ncbi:MAG TPA: SPFH domain-containing protein [Burkholderiales bacterium]|nr:SPFH domain-containing protein [Burkholderiales bacterium]